MHAWEEIKVNLHRICILIRWICMQSFGDKRIEVTCLIQSSQQCHCNCSRIYSSSTKVILMLFCFIIFFGVCTLGCSSQGIPTLVLSLRALLSLESLVKSRFFHIPAFNININNQQLIINNQRMNYRRKTHP